MCIKPLVVLFLGEYKNPSFTHEESAIHMQMPGVYRRPAPVYQLNGPSMDTGSRQWSPSEATYPPSQTAYGHNRPFSNAELSRPTSLNLRDFSSNLVSATETQSVFGAVVRWPWSTKRQQKNRMHNDNYKNSNTQKQFAKQGSKSRLVRFFCTVDLKYKTLQEIRKHNGNWRDRPKECM